MGLVLSRFRSTPTRVEILEQIDKDIRAIQEFKRHNQYRLKHHIGTVFIYSLVIYVIAFVVFYFFYFPQTWEKRLFYSLPFLVFPFGMWVAKKVIHWIYIRKISENEFALQDLRERKRKVLEEVMENETYKTAKEILEKFDPQRSKTFADTGNPIMATPPGGTQMIYRHVYPPSRNGVGFTNTGVRQRQAFRSAASPVATAQSGASPPSVAPGQQQQGRRPVTTPTSVHNDRTTAHTGPPPGPPTPRPILPLQRSNIDKLVEYLVGDGPGQRYALICRQCWSHNGMALQEEFEYLAFRCAYCYAFNPARKLRPQAPRIQFPSPGNEAEPSESSSSEDEGDEKEEKENESTEASPTRGDAETPAMSGDTEPNHSVNKLENVSMASTDGGEGRAPSSQTASISPRTGDATVPDSQDKS